MRIEALPGRGSVVARPNAAAWFGAEVSDEARESLLGLLVSEDSARSVDLADRVAALGVPGRLALLRQAGALVAVVIAGEIFVRQELVRLRGESPVDLLHAELVVDQTLQVVGDPWQTGEPGFLDGDETRAGGGLRLHVDRLPGAGAAAPFLAPAPPPVVGPVVDGVECVRGHFNRPGVRYCVICGIALLQGIRPVRGRRPPLGVLVAAGGSVPLNGDIVIGAAPESDPDVMDGLASGLRIDGGPSVADAHVRLVVRDWTVELHDLGSTGITRVFDPRSGTWSDVEPSGRVALPAGSTIQIGQATIEYRDRREHE